MSDPDASARELLRDSFTRLIEHVDELTDGLTDDKANYRPGPDANSIAVEFSALDYSVQRAILEASPFPPIPAGFDKDSARVEFTFELKR